MKAITQTQLLKAARKAPNKANGLTKRGIDWPRYMPVIDLLHNKGYNNKEVAVFLTEHGIACTQSAVQQAISRRRRALKQRTKPAPPRKTAQEDTDERPVRLL